jgi:tetratricopeptide (TPR) repeat protein
MKIFLMISVFFFPLLAQAQILNDGERAFYYQRYESAEKIFHKILDVDPSNSEAWAFLMRSYIQQGKFKLASDTFDHAPESIRQLPFFHIAAGTVMLSKNNKKGANDHFQQAIDLTKGKNVPVLVAIADANIESPNGDYSYAIDLLQKAIKKDKKNASLETKLGQANRRLHNGSEAYKAFMKAIDKNQHETLAYYELGRLFLSQKNKDLYAEYFTKAVEKDPLFGPAHYELYNYYLYSDPVKAYSYFHHYLDNSDYSLQQEYSLTDLLYLTKKYDSAILSAQGLIRTQGDKVQPRLYKLISYSYQEKGDSTSALPYMLSYFEKEADSNFIRKDYENMALLYQAKEGKEDSTFLYYKKALLLAAEPSEKIPYYRELARLSRELNNSSEEAFWLGRIYSDDPTANNVTLFNWGLAAYKAEDYQQADSVFGLYTSKYPDQGFGYYWRARTNARIDTSMAKGLAVPYYLNLLEVIAKDTLSSTDTKWMKEAYGYLASYEANTEKDYGEAINYFEKLMVIDPSNEQVARNIKILEKNIEIMNKNENGSH